MIFFTRIKLTVGLCYFYLDIKLHFSFVETSSQQDLFTIWRTTFNSSLKICFTLFCFDSEQWVRPLGNSNSNVFTVLNGCTKLTLIKFQFMSLQWELHIFRMSCQSSRSSTPTTGLSKLPPIITNEADRDFLYELNGFIDRELSKINAQSEEQRYLVYKAVFNKVWMNEWTRYFKILNQISTSYPQCEHQCMIERDLQSLCFYSMIFFLSIFLLNSDGAINYLYTYLSIQSCFFMLQPGIALFV